MVYERVSLEIRGDDFYPKRVRAFIDIKFESESSPGDIGNIGRYKGLKIPFGSARIEPPANVHNPIFWVLNYIKDKIEVLRNNGGTDIKLSVAYYYNGQCNCELGLDEISLLYTLKIPFIFSVYEDEELIEILSPE